MKLTYRTQGTCSVAIDVEVADGIVKRVQFMGGCNGNTKGLCQLVSGMRAEDVIQRLEGTKCRERNTSCPDQLAQALKLAIAEE